MISLDGKIDYGPWKFIGGVNKRHPKEDEIVSAVEFMRNYRYIGDFILEYIESLICEICLSI